MKHILVVDDENGILDVSKRILEAKGYLVHTALNALLALEVLKKEKVELIISDLKMPFMDGLSFLMEVKKQNFPAGFILITGYWVSDLEEIEKHKEHIFAILRKPFEFSEMVSLADKFFDESAPTAAKLGDASRPDQSQAA